MESGAQGGAVLRTRHSDPCVAVALWNTGIEVANMRENVIMELEEKRQRISQLIDWLELTPDQIRKVEEACPDLDRRVALLEVTLAVRDDLMRTRH